MADMLTGKIDRKRLAQFIPDERTIREFEGLFQDVSTTTPINLAIVTRATEEASIDAGSALAAGNENAAAIERLRFALSNVGADYATTFLHMGG